MLGQWSKAELLSQSPVPTCTWACPCHPVGERAGPRLEHNSRCATFPPGRSSARGCIWSFYFCVWVGYSQCPNSRKRQHQKQSPISKTQGRASDTECTDQHLCCSPSAHRRCQLLVECPFQITQENFKGKALPGAPEAGGSSHHSSSPLKSPVLFCFLSPTSRSSLRHAHATSEGHPTPSRRLRSLLQKAELVRSELSGRHEELFHPASPQLFYPSTFKNNGAIQLFKTKVVCFFLW